MVVVAAVAVVVTVVDVVVVVVDAVVIVVAVMVVVMAVLAAVVVADPPPCSGLCTTAVWSPNAIRELCVIPKSRGQP